jgi:hypothetical protein
VSNGSIRIKDLIWMGHYSCAVVVVVVVVAAVSNYIYILIYVYCWLREGEQL